MGGGFLGVLTAPSQGLTHPDSSPPKGCNSRILDPRSAMIKHKVIWSNVEWCDCKGCEGQSYRKKSDLYGMVVDSPLKSVCLLIGLTPCPSHPLSLHQYFPFSPFFCSFSINSIPFSSYLLTHLSTIIRPTNIWYLSHLFHPHNSTLYPVLHVMKIPDVIQGLRPHPIP